MVFLIALIIVCLFFLLNLALIKNNSAGSDHYYHMGLINGIKDNNHKFVSRHPNIIGEKYFAYPQFYHFILSFLPKKYYEDYYNFLYFIITIISALMYFVFLFTVYPFINSSTSFLLFSLFALLFYILTPFSYAAYNAKNRGLSVRGFGLLCGQLYLYFIIWYYLYENPIFMFGVFFTGFIILISNQFAFQFILFSAPIFALLYQNVLFLVVPISAFLFFYLLMPNIAKNYFRGQIGHKKIYYRYIAPFSFLNYRYSVWRYLVWDFWIRLKDNYKPAIGHLYYNPAIRVITCFPFLTASIIGFFINIKIREIILKNNIVKWSIPIIASLIIFTFTSFRKTRFLGEPERYIEFSIPFISILSTIVFLSINRMVIYAVFIFSLLLVLFEILYLNKRGVVVGRKIEKLTKILVNLYNGDKDNRIFSNNIDTLKYFLGKGWKVLIPNLTSEFTGTFHFKDIFPNGYGSVCSGVILPLVREFKINWFILDTNLIPKYDFLLTDKSVYIEEKNTVDNYKILRICLRN